jgi:hypothetical protein
MIVMSVFLIHFVLSRTGITRMRASGYSLKEGILATLPERYAIDQMIA